MLLMIVGCGEGSSSLRVDFRTDLVAEFELSRVNVTLDGDLGRSVSIVRGQRLIEGIVLTDYDPVAQGRHRVQADLFGPDGRSIGQRAVEVVVRDTTLVTLVFTRSCVSVSCPDAERPECVNGRCVPSDCSPENPDACGASLCESAAMCDAPAASCAEAVCTADHLCLQRPVAGGCAAMEVCLPDEGCAPLPGAVDAGCVEGGCDTGCTLTNYYRDADGDGYGGLETVSGCVGTVPPMSAATPGDCEDTDPAIHPAAAEICDGTDNDCNGRVDDPFILTCGSCGGIITGGSIYQFCRDITPATWEEAMLLCEESGTAGVVIEDASENTMIEGLLAMDACWIGLRARDVAGRVTYTWRSGETASYVDPIVDVAAGRDCFAMARGSTAWTDHDCEEALTCVVCERPAD